MPQAITIDDFPIETSVQWAEGQNYVEHIAELKNALSILHQTEITVATPTYDHLTLLFEQHKKAPTWASFEPPLHFLHQSNRFFHQTVISDINPTMLLESYELHIDALQEQGVSLPAEPHQYLLHLLETLESLNVLLSEIRAQVLRHRKA
jgi:hypothetical protein